MKRIVCMVLDGFGVGEAPDAAKYGDTGSNTLANLSKAIGGIKLPNLEKMGIGLLGKFEGISPVTFPKAVCTRLAEKSEGKDTTTGHWELAGLVTKKPFPLFPNGFPKVLLDAFIKEAGVPGIFGNRHASGTQIIEEFGEEHIRTGKLIVYTSGDSVFQIAAHEKYFGLERLYRTCEIARKLTDPYQVGRVIARPFVGEKKGEFQRTEHRKDYSIPPGKNLLDYLQENSITTCSVGKIEDIFDHRGLKCKNHTGNNRDGMLATLDFLDKNQNQAAFIFANLVDFDQLYGHRRDPKGYAQSLVEFDNALPILLSKLTDEDCLILTGDHGCDPTFVGTDHTREYVPFIAYSPKIQGRKIEDRVTFADVGASILKMYGIDSVGKLDAGESIF